MNNIRMRPFGLDLLAKRHITATLYRCILANYQQMQQAFIIMWVKN